MLTPEKIKKNLFATLCELQNTEPNHDLKISLVTRLQVLYDILDDDMDEGWDEQLEKFICL